VGFVLFRQKVFYERWKADVRGEMRLVTVDCPKEPFVALLLTLMVRQSGYRIDE